MTVVVIGRLHQPLLAGRQAYSLKPDVVNLQTHRGCAVQSRKKEDWRPMVNIGVSLGWMIGKGNYLEWDSLWTLHHLTSHTASVLIGCLITCYFKQRWLFMMRDHRCLCPAWKINFDFHPILPQNSDYPYDGLMQDPFISQDLLCAKPLSIFTLDHLTF